MNSQKGFAPLIIIVIVVAVLGIGAGVFLFTKNQSLQAQLTNLKDEKTKTETELAVLKATNLAKEVEFLRLNLKATEKDLAALQNEVPDLKARIRTFETGVSKLESYLNAIDAIENMVGGGPTAAGIASVDSALNKLNDSSVSDRWANAKRGIDLERKSWQGTNISDTVITVTSRIRDFFR